MLDRIEYLTDILTVDSLEERVDLVNELMKDGKIIRLQEHINRLKREEAKNRVKESEIA